MKKINILGVEVEVSEADARKLTTELTNRGMLYTPKEWHYSQSKTQWVKISEMALEHLTNAFIQEYKNSVHNLFSDYKSHKISLHEMLTNLSTLATEYFEHSNALFREMVRRDSTPFRYNP